MNLSDLIPVAAEHLWAGSKDLDRTLARAHRLVAAWDPDLEAYRAVDAARALADLPVGPSTRNRYRSALSSLLRAARMLGHPRYELPPKAAEGRPRDRVLTPAEEEALVSAPAPVGPLARFLLATGLRLSEVYAGRAQGPNWVCEDTKNGDRRVVPRQGLLPPPLPPERTLRDLWAKHAPEGVTPHTLRHTAVTRWVRQGVSLPAVQALAGHRSLVTTLRYTHLTPADLAAEISRTELDSAPTVG